MKGLKMLFFLRTLMLVVAISGAAWAEDIYIAQTVQGTDSGASCAEAHSVAWFNSASNWGDNAGKIGPGDTVHLCGTITYNGSGSLLKVQGSGIQGNPITIRFEDDAKLSAPVYGTASGWPYDAGIFVQSHNWIVIDGGTNGLIECTDNGGPAGGYSYHVSAIGITFSKSNHCEVKNLKIKNIYRPTLADYEPNTVGGQGVYVNNCSHISLHDNYVEQAGVGFMVTFYNDTDIEIFNNKTFRCAMGVKSGIGSDGYTADDLRIHHNRIHNTDLFDYNDGMEIFGRSTTKDAFTRIKIYDNVIGPDIYTFGHPATAWILCAVGWIVEPEIYNNVLIAGPNDGQSSRAIHFIETGGNGHASGLTLEENSKIYNNTLISESPYSTLGIYLTKRSIGHQIYNNVMYAKNTLLAVLTDNVSTMAYCDYNAYYSEGSLQWNLLATYYNNFSQWQALGYDTHGFNSDPKFVNKDNPAGLDGIFWTNDDGLRLAAGSPCIGSGRFGGDIGAYEYVPVKSQIWDLNAGWNWISFHVLPADRFLNSVFSGIIGQIEQVKIQTQSAIRSSGNWKGDLANMSGIGQYKMYKVKVSQACTLTVTGTTIASATPIALMTGWNWVAFLPTTAMPIATALASINSQVQEVKSQTQSATYSGGVWSGTLTQLNPGQGYAIKMSGAGTLTYPATASIQLNQQREKP
jgi:hypothetical protein